MISQKRADALPSGIFMMYRIVIITVIALTVLGLSVVFYSYNFNVKDVEARILTRNVLYCLTPEGYADMGDLTNEDTKYNLLSYCGYSGDLDRVYVYVEFNGGSLSEPLILQSGDSGSVWVKEIARRSNEFARYVPGYYSQNYEINVLMNDGSDIETINVFVEVYVYETQ
jgi:hypothetical protein